MSREQRAQEFAASVNFREDNAYEIRLKMESFVKEEDKDEVGFTEEEEQEWRDQDLSSGVNKELGSRVRYLSGQSFARFMGIGLPQFRLLTFFQLPESAREDDPIEWWDSLRKQNALLHPCAQEKNQLILWQQDSDSSEQPQETREEVVVNSALLQGKEEDLNEKLNEMKSSKTCPVTIVTFTTEDQLLDGGFFLMLRFYLHLLPLKDSEVENFLWKASFYWTLFARLAYNEVESLLDAVLKVVREKKVQPYRSRLRRLFQ